MGDQALSAKTASWPVPEELKEVRLDFFAHRCLPHLSRRALQSAIGEKLFWINSRAARKGDKLTAGDQLVFKGPAHWLMPQPLADPALQVPIVYEDAAIMVLDKPAGVATHGFSARDTLTLANFLMAQRPELAAVGKSRWESGLVHRLDRETSGLVLVAKSRAAFDSLRLQFSRRKVIKIYWALVWGNAEAEGVIDYPLAHDSRDPRRMRALMAPAPRPKAVRRWPALTRFRKLCRRRGLSLLEVEMESGVTHQIRVHLSAVGHPIVADTLYGAPGAETFGLDRHFLHARSLQFSHPETDRVIKVEAELPAQLEGVLKRLKMKF